jgi:hypothetical protein
MAIKEIVPMDNGKSDKVCSGVVILVDTKRGHNSSLADG